MIGQQIGKIINPCLLHIRTFQTTCPMVMNQKWRKEKGMPLNPNAYGVLTDSPDYTYLDGRLTPYGVGQKKRILKQREIVSQIVDLTQEIDFAVERHNQVQQEEEKRKKAILDKKLKPKGLALLKSK